VRSLRSYGVPGSHAYNGFPSTAAEVPLSGSFRQPRAKHRGHDRPHSLLMSGQGRTLTRDELAQQDMATTQRLHGLKGFQKTLPSGHRLEASGGVCEVVGCSR
jgi:hypothetical protein